MSGSGTFKIARNVYLRVAIGQQTDLSGASSLVANEAKADFGLAFAGAAVDPGCVKTWSML